MGGVQAKGCKNSGELKAILMKRIMIRRLKANVLKELPAKCRKVCPFNDSHMIKTLDYKTKWQDLLLETIGSEGEV